MIFFEYSILGPDGEPTGEHFNNGFAYYVIQRSALIDQYNESRAWQSGSEATGVVGGTGLMICWASGWGAAPCTALFLFGAGGTVNAFRENTIGDDTADAIQSREEPLIAIFEQYCPDCLE